MWLLPLVYLLAGFPLGPPGAPPRPAAAGRADAGDDPARVPLAGLPELRDLRRRPACRATSLMVADEPGPRGRRGHRAASDHHPARWRSSRSCSCSAGGGQARRCGASCAPVLAGAAALSAVHGRLRARQVRRRRRAASITLALRDPERGPDHLPDRPAAGSPRPLGARRPARRATRSPRSPGALRDALARALRDPTLELAYWVPEYEAYVGADGEPVALPAEPPGASRRYVERHHAPRGGADPRRQPLTTSRELVGAVDERRRDRARERAPAGRPARAACPTCAPRAPASWRPATPRAAGSSATSTTARSSGWSSLSRDTARSMPATVPADSTEPAAADRARDELSASLEELRNIARGIHPAILSDHGLPVALESLAARAPVRVDARRRPRRAPAASRSRSPPTT